MKDICNVIQRVVLFIFVAPAKILDWRNAFLVLQYKRNANVWIFLKMKSFLTWDTFTNVFVNPNNLYVPTWG